MRDPPPPSPPPPLVFWRACCLLQCDAIQFIRILGHGSYGEVAKCEDLLEGGLVAVKRVLNVFNSEVCTERTAFVRQDRQILKWPSKQPNCDEEYRARVSYFGCFGDS